MDKNDGAHSMGKNLSRFTANIDIYGLEFYCNRK